MSEKYRLVLAPSAERDLERLPELIAADVKRFLNGPLLKEPYKAGKPLGGQDTQDARSAGREGATPSATMLEASEHSWRVLYRVDANTHTIRVMVVGHRPRVVRRLAKPETRVPFVDRFR
ncbi:type II toxin-antitoxin system RelE family toxin [Pseudofrankia saprophytica]|jgi:mRNA-degrading endonuclease RelE of RelBE toxin-antitoxin system|uniref:type II toxin-antitoxin system RelE family toxin n=1 Tax=Pseudofrankia saprophytica TaxID=298655 RepID=UPI000234B697|nr:type II toxin-antitoxin system RelE/ParE family toxin [Pseudofrankia saprophytica]